MDDWLTVRHRPERVAAEQVWWLAAPDGTTTVGYVFADWSINATPGPPWGQRLEFTDRSEAERVAANVNARLGCVAVVVHEGRPQTWNSF